MYKLLFKLFTITEPATAEIDLNSDDSSSNRGSLEKELPDQQINETASDSPMEEAASFPTISLFSRAATGMDAFSRMITGTSDPGTRKSETAKQDISSEPSVVTMSQPTDFGGVSQGVVASTEASITTIFRAPTTQVSSTLYQFATSDTQSAISSSDTAYSSTNESSIAPASSLFSSTSPGTKVLFQTANIDPPSKFSFGEVRAPESKPAATTDAFKVGEGNLQTII